MTEVVELRGGAPSLQDIPALLRRLADRIEAGEQEAETLFVLIPRQEDYPELYGWGNVDGDRGPIAQLAMCQHWLIENCCRRRP